MKTLTPGKKMMKVAVANKKAPAAKSRYTVEEGDYNGHPTLTFTDSQAQNPKWASFSMGVSKLRAVVNCLDAVKAFLAANDEPKVGK